MQRNPISVLFVLALGCSAASRHQQPPPGSPPSYAIHAGAATVVADGSSTARIDVTARTGAGAALPGVAVQFEIAGEGASLAPAATVTDASGTATALAVATAAGTKTVHATIGGVVLAAQLTFAAPTPVPVPGVTLTIDTDKVTADGSSGASITLVLHDLAGNPLAGKPVDLSTLGAQNTLSAHTGVTDATGTFSTRLSSQHAENKIVVAHGGSARLSRSVAFVAGPPDPAKSGLHTSAGRIASDGQTPARLEVLVADATGNPIAATPVSLTASGTGNQLSAEGGVTDAKGNFHATLTSAVAETKTVTALAAGMTFHAEVAFARGAPSAAHSTLTVTPASLRIDAAATVALVLRDADSNPIGAAPVRLSASGAGGRFDPAFGQTAAAGSFSTALHSDYAEIKTVTASMDGLSLQAQVTFTSDPWQAVAHGIPGGLVHAVAFDRAHPSVAYAGAAGGVFKSVDSGATWKQASDWNGWADCLVVDPVTSDVYVCAGLASVSRDGGATWTAVYANDGATGLALAGGTLYVSFVNSGVFRSTDGGRTLKHLAVLVDAKVKGVAVDPSNGATVYAWSNEEGISRSTDSGATWAGISAALDASKLRGFAVDQSAPARLYAYLEGAGLFRSDDAGAHWRASGANSADLMVSALIVTDPADPDSVYLSAGQSILRSVDRANTWTRISGIKAGEPVVAYGLAVDPGNPARVIAGGIGLIQLGAFASADRGSHWSFSSDGITVPMIESLAADPFSRDVALASVDGLLVKTTDAGGTWRSVHDTLPARSVLSLTADPAAPGTYYAVVWNDGIYKSTDAGETWNRTVIADLDFQANVVSVVRSTPTTIYASNGYNSPLYRTRDGAATWTLLAGPERISAIGGCDAKPESLYAGGTSGIFRSGDGGATWTRVHAALTNPNDSVFSVAVDPNDDAIAYVGTYDSGLLRTLDGGATWKEVSAPVSVAYAVRALTVDPGTPTRLFAAMMNRVYRSEDRGDTWQLVDTGMAAAASVELLSISLADPGLIYAGTASNGIWRTSSGAK